MIPVPIGARTEPPGLAALFSPRLVLEPQSAGYLTKSHFVVHNKSGCISADLFVKRIGMLVMAELVRMYDMRQRVRNETESFPECGAQELLHVFVAETH